MSALEAAERRLTDALARLEAAILVRPTPESWAAERQRLEAQLATLDRDCELLRAECDRLRRELEELQARHERLREAAATVEARLGGVIEELDELGRS
jgi:chromosome segregation ATPase